jgi:hypothetical protein
MLHVSDVHLLFLALRRYSVDVVDTAGSPELFEHLAHGYIESSDAFVCVYSALNPASLDVARGMMTVIGIKIKYYRACFLQLKRPFFRTSCTIYKYERLFDACRFT